MLAPARKGSLTMGTVLPNGYGLWKPTVTLDGSTKIFQTAIMFRNDSGLSAFSAAGLIRGIWTAAGRPLGVASMYIGYTLASTETYVMAGGVLTYDLDSTPIVGTKAGSSGTPINTSVIVKKDTGIVGKRYRGRIMLPNMTVPEANISQAGIIDSTGLATIQGQYTAANTAMQASVCPQVLGHSTSEVLPTFINLLTVNPKMGSMPHRIRGF